MKAALIILALIVVVLGITVGAGFSCLNCAGDVACEAWDAESAPSYYGT